jgi:CMP-N-acetylneuraminic acid synthetase
LRVLGLIPARGGSKGIPHKNIANVFGKPLIAWTIEEARNASLDRLVMSSDSSEIIQVAEAIGGVEVPFIRPGELAADDTPAVEVVLHALKWLRRNDRYEPDAVMILQPTSPLRRSAQIDEAIALLFEREADTVVSVVKVPHNMVPGSLMQIRPDGVLEAVLPLEGAVSNRHAKKVFYARNGPAILLIRREQLLERQSLYGNRMIPFVMSREDSFDIDDEFDLKMCELMLRLRSGEDE